MNLFQGWKSRITEIKTKTGSTSMQWFLSPDGKMFRGRKSALRYIETCDYYSKEEVRLFKSKPTTEKKFTKEFILNFYCFFHGGMNTNFMKTIMRLVRNFLMTMRKSFAKTKRLFILILQ